MEKKKLNEDAGTLISVISYAFTFATLGLALWAVKKAFNAAVNGISKLTGGGDVLADKKTIDVIDSLVKNKEFIKDFGKIIMDEGGFDEFIKKTASKTKDGSIGFMNQLTHYGYQNLTKNNFDLDFGSDAKKVVDRLTKTSSFKRATSKLGKSEIQYIANMLFITIISPEFEKFGRDNIMNQLKKEIPKVKENSTKLKNLLPK